MVNRVNVKGELLQWAATRSRRAATWLDERFPQLEAWTSGTVQPTLKQLEDYAKAVHVPVGMLFLVEPPVETLPVPDFRTVRNQDIEHPSPDLLETVYACQERQDWYRDFARGNREDALRFVGSAAVADDVEAAAASIADALQWDWTQRPSFARWDDALRAFAERADELGVLVMINGVVGANTHRKLDPDEFRGFALADKLAPLVFINGADSKAAQMFTLAHELAHLWLGKSGVSDLDPEVPNTNAVEQWCNRVAAELLVPRRAFLAEYRVSEPRSDEVQRLARVFKVSTVVILRRMLDAGLLSHSDFWRAYNAERERLRPVKRKGGGNFYNTQGVRLSPRFGRAVVLSALEGQTLYRDAFRLLGVNTIETFNALASHFGVA